MTIDSSDTDRSKRAVFETLLEHGIVIVHLDARAVDVQVPRWLRDRSWLTLNFSHRFHIEDFAFDDLVVTASLSFQGTTHACTIPWTAVFAVSSQVEDEMYIWRQDVPSEHAGDLMETSGDSDPSDPAPETSLHVVDGGRRQDRAPTDRKTGHLRRVK